MHAQMCLETCVGARRTFKIVSYIQYQYDDSSVSIRIMGKRLRAGGPDPDTAHASHGACSVIVL